MTTYANLTANGVQATKHTHAGGDLQVLTSGDYDGAVVTINAELDDLSEYIPIAEAKTSRAQTRVYTLKAGEYEVQVSGVTGGGTDITVDLKS